MKSTYSVIGIMAGSSMDGLDIAQIDFSNRGKFWSYNIQKALTIPYEEDIYLELKTSPNQKKVKQLELDTAFGKWVGEQINRFKIKMDKVDLIGLHGHTITHRPHDGISWQLGNGAIISEMCHIPVVTDFRSLDIELGGQGAPLVPFGDFHLFNEFDACLNLGGIANISQKSNKTAWDISPCNQILNYFSNKLDEPYDEGGRFARNGNFDRDFYEYLSSIEYFSCEPPKSLPNNFISKNGLNKINPTDGLHTYCHFIADLISKSLGRGTGKILVTGGGAHNDFLIELICNRIKNWEVIVPDKILVDFKESLVFAFLALRRFRNEINVLASVTGASKDSSSGVIHLP